MRSSDFLDLHSWTGESRRKPRLPAADATVDQVDPVSSRPGVRRVGDEILASNGCCSWPRLLASTSSPYREMVVLDVRLIYWWANGRSFLLGSGSSTGPEENTEESPRHPL